MLAGDQELRIYGDECGHCNFGWRLLGDLLPDDTDLKELLGRYLRVAFARLERHQLQAIPARTQWPPAGAAAGLCSGEDARALYYATVEQAIIPGLEAHGVGRARDAAAGD